MFQTGSGAHPASYPMGNRGSYPGVKAAETWICTSTLQYSFMVWCSVKKAQRQLYFLPFRDYRNVQKAPYESYVCK
jgi:hypothetical protein